VVEVDWFVFCTAFRMTMAWCCRRYGVLWNTSVNASPLYSNVNSLISSICSKGGRSRRPEPTDPIFTHLERCWKLQKSRDVGYNVAGPRGWDSMMSFKALGQSGSLSEKSPVYHPTSRHAWSLLRSRGGTPQLAHIAPCTMSIGHLASWDDADADQVSIARLVMDSDVSMSQATGLWLTDAAQHKCNNWRA